jgi:hypothetical protein
VLISRANITIAVTSAGSPSMGPGERPPVFRHFLVGELAPRWQAPRQYQVDRGRPHGSLFDADLRRFARADSTSKQI